VSTLDQADNPRRLVSGYDDSDVSSIAYPYPAMLGGVPGWVPSYRLSPPLRGLMFSRYRGGSASSLHLANAIANEIFSKDALHPWRPRTNVKLISSKLKAPFGSFG
jgi:hypothetical protein